jgi:hypothetical protein
MDYKKDIESLIDIIKLQFTYIEALQMIKYEELFSSIEKLEKASEQINRILPDVDQTTELKNLLIKLKDYIDTDLKYVTEFTSTSTPMLSSLDLEYSEEVTTSTIFSYILSLMCCHQKSSKEALISAKNQEIEDLKTKIVLLHSSNKALRHNKTKQD